MFDFIFQTVAFNGDFCKIKNVTLFLLIQSLAWVELEDTYELGAVNTLQDAVNTILKYLGLAADTGSGSGKVNQGVHTHTLLSSGKCNWKNIFYFISNVYQMSCSLPRKRACVR